MEIENHDFTEDACKSAEAAAAKVWGASAESEKGSNTEKEDKPPVNAITSFSDALYEKIADVLGNSNPDQYLCLTIPGQALTREDFAYDYKNNAPKGPAVEANESNLVNKLFDPCRMTGAGSQYASLSPLMPAGTYTVTPVCGNKNYDATFTPSITYVVSKASLSFSLKSTSGKYTGAEHDGIDVSFTGLKNGQSLQKTVDYTLTFAAGEDGQLGAGNMPRGVGSYTVTVTLNDSELAKNYELSANTATYTITSAESGESSPDGDIGPLVLVVVVEAVMLFALIAAVVVLKKR